MRLSVHLDTATKERLDHVAAETGRTVAELAEAAIAEAALQYFRGREDPGDLNVAGRRGAELLNDALGLTRLPAALTIEQRNLARHALGLEDSGRTRSYRNRYFAAAGSRQMERWREMVAAGFASEGAANPSNGMRGYFLTRAGAEAALLAGETLDPEDFPPCA